MKQFIAVLFLITYSISSIGSPVAVHQCSYKQQLNNPAQACNHHVSAAMDCCSTTQMQCSIRSDDNSIELAFYKQLQQEYYPATSAYNNEVKHPVPVSSSLVNRVPLVVYKIRLHLYKRVLLI